MSKKSFRVYFITHHDGHKTGVMLRTWDTFFDRPSPSAYGSSEDDVYRQLETLLREIEVSGDDSLAVCYPSPFEFPLGHFDRHREQARLVRIWEHLGFRHYRDHVFVCDPAAGELDSALNDLTKVMFG